MEKLKSDVVSGVRACLVSTKGKMELRQLDNDYRTLVGERIPYFKLGFKKLEEFIQSEPTLVITRGNNGEMMVDAKISEKSAHITEMVYKQKQDKKKVLKKGVRFAPRVAPAKLNNWRPKNMGPRGDRFFEPPRLSKVSHNQFINRSRYDKPSVPSKIVIPETSTFHVRQNPQLQRQNSESTRPSISRLQLSQLSRELLEINAEQETCSALTGAKKRITQKMLEMSLEKQVGNGNHSLVNDISTQEVSEPKIKEFKRTNNPMVDLKKFVEMYKVGELEISSKVLKSKSNRMCTCLVKVGKHSYTSYPKEFNGPDAAEQYCAEEALKDLIPKYQKNKSLLFSSDMDILVRIPPMLEKHHNGIWEWQLQLDYADKYNEQLPLDWLKIMDSSPCIQVEKCLDNYVLRHCKPGDALQRGQKWSTFMTLSDVSVPLSTVHFGVDGKLYAEVTCVMSANEIWCRQHSTEESEVYNETIARMDTYYNLHGKNLKSETVTEGGHYVAKYDNMWCRVRAVEIPKQGHEVQCFFIDYGDEMAIPKDDIYQLKREFAGSQAQAFVCRLAGLEELYEASASSEKIQSLLYKQVILEMATENADDNKDISMPVLMYDFQTGNSINQELIPLLTMESASPIIQKDTVTEVYVSNIESDGSVYVQIHSAGYESMQSLLADLEAKILADPPTQLIAPVTKENSEGKLYFAKYKVDGHWYRIQLADWLPTHDLAQIYFVDYGNKDIINVKEEVLYPLDTLSDVLSQYPFQAVKVNMAIKAIPNDFVALATKVMPDDQPVLLKIMDYDNNNIPWVQFFKRNPDGLFSINQSIELEAELKNGNTSNQKSISKKRLHFSTSKNVPSGGSLPRPVIPKKEDYFEVHVPFAVNPYNFFVQLYQSRGKLHKMMSALQERYKNVSYSPLQMDQVMLGNIYASKYDDGCWYRTSVMKVIHPGSISVFYCDFGYYGTLTLQQLIPLDVEFLELPYQALKAKLSDIKPKQSKWTIADCEDFKALVEKKNFYSAILDVEKDVLYESDTVLKLVLIDTSTDEDISIGKQLINKGIAVEG